MRVYTRWFLSVFTIKCPRLGISFSRWTLLACLNCMRKYLYWINPNQKAQESLLTSLRETRCLVNDVRGGKLIMRLWPQQGSSQLWGNQEHGYYSIYKWITRSEYVNGRSFDCVHIFWACVNFELVSTLLFWANEIQTCNIEFCCRRVWKLVITSYVFSDVCNSMKAVNWGIYWSNFFKAFLLFKCQS